MRLHHSEVGLKTESTVRRAYSREIVLRCIEPQETRRYEACPSACGPLRGTMSSKSKSSAPNWKDNKERWLREQREIASRVIVLEDDELTASSSPRFARIPLDPPGRYWGGVDVSFPPDEDEPAIAVYVVLDVSTMKVVYQDSELFFLDVPYIPSFLAFREIDPLQRLVEKQLSNNPGITPSAILVDGNGVLHPRGAGIACFLGVRTGIPTIGIGKTLFCEGGLTKRIVLDGIEESLAAVVGMHLPTVESSTENKECLLVDSVAVGAAVKSKTSKVGPEKSTRDRGDLVKGIAPCQGLAVPLLAKTTRMVRHGIEPQNIVIACALVGHGGGKNDSGTKNPIFVSVGHKVSLHQAVKITAYLSRYRIPEPVRQADLRGRRIMRKETAKRKRITNKPSSRPLPAPKKN